jgi:hypothetical protein
MPRGAATAKHLGLALVLPPQPNKNAFVSGLFLS